MFTVFLKNFRCAQEEGYLLQIPKRGPKLLPCDNGLIESSNWVNPVMSYCILMYEKDAKFIGRDRL